MDTSPLRIGYCLSLSGALASNGKTARLAHQIWQENADPLGYYVAPLAYAQLQVLEQAIRAVSSTDDAALSDYTRKATFETVVGNVTFGEGGGWARPRVLTVRFQNIGSNNISEFKRPNTQAVVHPSETASAGVIYPYAKARR